MYEVSGFRLNMFASAATGLRALQRCARGVRWSAYHQDGQYQALRFLSACPISCSSSKDDSASDGVENSSSGAQGGGDSGRGANSPGQIVDPAKDASLQDLFVIPIKKPLIPGACLEDYPSGCCLPPSGWVGNHIPCHHPRSRQIRLYCSETPIHSPHLGHSRALHYYVARSRCQPRCLE